MDEILLTVSCYWLAVQLSSSHINVDRLDGVDMDVRGWGGAIPLAKLVAVVLLSRSKGLWDRNGFGRGHSRMAQRPEENRDRRVLGMHDISATISLSAKIVNYSVIFIEPIRKFGQYILKPINNTDNNTSDAHCSPWWFLITCNIIGITSKRKIQWSATCRASLSYYNITVK